MPKDEVLRRWRDIDSGWIYAGVNPTGRTPNTYRLDHSAPQWGQDTLSMILQYQSTDIPDEVLFRVQYLRAKRAPERRDES